MNVFERLNHEDGISIVMVTHEPDIGARAKRRLHMKDGLVVRED